MATNRALGSFVHFRLPLEDDGHVGICWILCCPMYEWVLFVCMSISWMTWTRYVTITLGAEEKQKIQNDFGFSFMHSSCTSPLRCTNNYCHYMYCNGGIRNCAKWTRSTPTPFCVGEGAPKKLRLECKVCILHQCALHCIMLA